MSPVKAISKHFASVTLSALREGGQMSLVRRQRRRGALQFEYKPVRVIGSGRLCVQGGWQDFLNQSGSETAIRSPLYRGPTVFHPLKFELVGLYRPRDFNATGTIRPCTILGRIRAQFIQKHGDRKCCSRRHLKSFSRKGHADVLADVGTNSRLDDGAQIRADPPIADKQLMSLAQSD